MNTDKFKQQLKAKEEALLGQLARAGKRARESGNDPAGDAGDESVAEEQKDEQFRGSDADWTTLGQVREALQRIDDGTFGACLADGEPIEEKRLNAIPWAGYCLQHQQQTEGAAAPRKPTL
jgi:DnaK suppressor protein